MIPKSYAPFFQKNSRSALAGDLESTVADIPTLAVDFFLVFELSRQKTSIKKP
jgi:hypothetical protein